MASKALFLICLNLVFFTLVSSNYTPTPCPPPPPSTPHHHHHGGHHGDHHGGGVPSTGSKCPNDALKIEACADVLNGLVHVVVGSPRTTECCSLLNGLADVDAAICLCTIVKANVLSLVHLNIPIYLNVLLNYCGRADCPSDFKCYA